MASCTALWTMARRSLFFWRARLFSPSFLRQPNTLYLSPVRDVFPKACLHAFVALLTQLLLIPPLPPSRTCLSFVHYKPHACTLRSTVQAQVRGKSRSRRAAYPNRAERGTWLSQLRCRQLGSLLVRDIVKSCKIDERYIPRDV